MKTTAELEQDNSEMSKEATIVPLGIPDEQRLPLLNIPAPALLRIFSFLSGREAARVTSTCRTLLPYASQSPVRQTIANEAIGITIYRSGTYLWLGRNDECLLAHAGSYGSHDVYPDSYTSHGGYAIATVPSLITRFTQVQLPKSFHRITEVNAISSDGPRVATVIGRDVNKKPLLGALYNDGTHCHLLDIPECFDNITEFEWGRGLFIGGTDKAGHPLLALSNGNRSYSCETLPSNFSKMTKTTVVTPNFSTEPMQGFLCGEDTHRNPLILRIKYDFYYSDAATNKNAINNAINLEKKVKVRIKMLILPPEFTRLTHFICLPNGDVTHSSFYLLFGFNKVGDPILARCNGKNHEGTQFLIWPPHFTHTPQFSANFMGAFMHGTDTHGKPLLMALSWYDMDFDVGSSRPSPVCSAITSVELPLNFAKISKVISALCVTFVYGTDVEGKVLLAGRGVNTSGVLGTGDNINRDTFELIALPANFVVITQIVCDEISTYVHGTDARGYPLLAVAGGNNCGNLGTGDTKGRNVFTLIDLPECLQPQFCYLLGQSRGPTL
jgi:hypothetical protein